MPIHLGAIAAGVAAKKAYPVLISAVQLTRNVRLADAAHAGPELKELVAATAELRQAVRGRGFKRENKRRRSEWEARRREALQPTVEFILAQRIVAAVRARGPHSGADLAEALGTVPQHETFVEALQLAERDRRIEPAGDGTWVAVTPATVLAGDSVLRNTGYVDELVECSATIAATQGLLSRDELAERVRELDGAHRFKATGFDAALEQAIADDRLAWLGPDLYGVPVEELADRDFAAQSGGGGDVAAAMKRVVAATQAVRSVLATGAAPAPGPQIADMPWQPADAASNGAVDGLHPDGTLR
jgi:hypothetical protein